MTDPRTVVAKTRAACVECGLIGTCDDEDAYCPWCGSRVPEPFELLAWAELRADEETRSDRRTRPRRVA